MNCLHWPAACRPSWPTSSSATRAKWRPFLRAANGLSAEEMQRLAEEARRLKKEEGT